MADNNAKLLTCPRCGEPLEEVTGELEPASVETVRVPFDCPSCEARLVVIVEGTSADVSDGDIWVEDRREADRE